jgi:hypothetical protein
MVHASKVPEMISVLVWLASNLAKIEGLTTTTDKIALCKNIGVPALTQISDSLLADACNLFKDCTNNAEDQLLA